MLRFIYSLFLFILAPFAILKLYISYKDKNKRKFFEYFGISKKNKEFDLWMHCASSGELLAAKPLLEQLKIQNPKLNILVTTFSYAGFKIAQKNNDLFEHRFLPLDFNIFIKIFLKKNSIKLAYFFEMEIWPNLLFNLKKKSIATFLINARLSNKTFKNYNVFSFFIKDSLNCFDEILAQSLNDKNNFEKLGFENTINVFGNLKYDKTYNLAQKNLYIQEQKQVQNKLIWVAISVHKAEENKIIWAHKELLKENPNILLILIPKHQKRFKKLELKLNTKKFKVAKRTINQKISPDLNVYLVDTIGEVNKFLPLAKFAFVGGSFNNNGGQNIIEPASFGIYCAIGKSWFNFYDITKKLLNAKCATEVKNKEQLAQLLIFWQKNLKKFKEQGEKSYAVLEAQKGATKRTLDFIVSIIYC